MRLVTFVTVVKTNQEISVINKRSRVGRGWCVKQGKASELRELW